LPEIEIEISVLSEPQPIVPEAIEVGRHGLLVIRGRQRGLLLPQVAVERCWNAMRLLEETCRKAGIETGGWRDQETELFGFMAEVFSEREWQLAAMATGPGANRTPGGENGGETG
jgi:uncharacterized protein